MDVSRHDLAVRFRDRSDAELLSGLQSGTLTPVAIDVAVRELRSRGIEPPPDKEESPSNREPSGVAPEELHHGSLDLVTVAEYWNPVEANLLRSLLESEGIFVHMWGEHLGAAHTFISVASGGMKLQVPANHVAQAKQLIAAFQRGELAMEDEAPGQSTAPGELQSEPPDAAQSKTQNAPGTSNPAKHATRGVKRAALIAMGLAAASIVVPLSLSNFGRPVVPPLIPLMLGVALEAGALFVAITAAARARRSNGMEIELSSLALALVLAVAACHIGFALFIIGLGQMH